MAFFVPPTQILVHAQFNLLFQFWIHTEVVRDLGPLEYILNTAKHHRVHHGKNPDSNMKYDYFNSLKTVIKMDSNLNNVNLD